MLTRLEIAFSVNIVCQFIQNPLEAHWKIVKGILRYLSRTLKFGLILRKTSTAATLDLVSFCDVDLTSNQDDRNSIFGYCVYLASNLITWQCKKQHTFSKSSIKAKYRSLANIVVEMSWLQSLLGELQVKCTKVPIIQCDNLSIVMLVAYHILHAMTNHIQFDLYFVKEQTDKYKSCTFYGSNF